MNRKSFKLEKMDNKVLFKSLLALLCLAMLVPLWLYIAPRLTGSTRTADQILVGNELRTTISKISLPGTKVHESVYDEGCSSNGVGLQERKSCGFKAERVVKGVGNRMPVLVSADSQLREDGFQRILMGKESDDDFSTALHNESSRDFRYFKTGKGSDIYVELSYFVDESVKSDNEIQELLDRKNLAYPQKGEYLLSVTGRESYYVCNSQLLEPCLFAPAPLSNLP